MSFIDVEKSSANNYFHNMKDQLQRLERLLQLPKRFIAAIYSGL